MSRVLLYHNLKRYFGTSVENFAKYSFRESRFMNKLLNGDRSKRKWYENKERPLGIAISEKITSNHISRRMTVLNKLFMKHITDLMATGEISGELLGKRIEVTHVKVTPDFQHVLIYWFSKKHGEQVETEKLLHDCAYKLRHELTQLRVIGRVPLLKFVKNTQLAALDDLEKRYKIADYGEEYEPISRITTPTEELTLISKLPSNVRQQILETQSKEEPEVLELAELEEDAFDVQLPPMRHDALGLDHHAIMSRVKHSLSKSHEAAKNRLSNVVSFTSTGTTATKFDPAAFAAAKNDSTAFTNFLAKQRMEERQKARRERRGGRLARINNDYEDGVDHEDFDRTEEEEDVDGFEDVSLESIRGTE